MATGEGFNLNFASVLATGRYSDFTLECEGHVFKTHKAILCSASMYFKGAIEGGMRESQDNKMILVGDEAAIVARLLIFIYTGESLKTKLSKWKHQGQTQFAHVKDNYQATESDWRKRSSLAIAMYQIADKTFIDELKWTSRTAFLMAIHPFQVDPEVLNSFWLREDTSDVVNIIKKVYDNTRQDDWMLHDPIVHRLLRGIKEHDALKMEAYQKLFEEVPRLAIELATCQLQSGKGEKCLACYKRTPQRLWRCKCGELEGCQNGECCQLRSTRQICDHCVKFARRTLQPYS